MKPFSIECIEPESGAAKPVEVKVIGFLDANSYMTFEKTMEGLIERQYAKFIVDLSALTYISSAGIGVLMVISEQLRRRQGDMILLQPSPKVYKILDLLGFTKIFQIVQDRDEALAAFG